MMASPVVSPVCAACCRESGSHSCSDRELAAVSGPEQHQLCSHHIGIGGLTSQPVGMRRNKAFSAWRCVCVCGWGGGGGGGGGGGRGEASVQIHV